MNQNNQIVRNVRNYAVSAVEEKSTSTFQIRKTNDSESFSDALSNKYKVLLGEFVHLLGLFWRHSMNAERARATQVLFNQLLQYLNILEMMPEHDKTILVRQVGCNTEKFNLIPDYIVVFGRVMINSKDDIQLKKSPLNSSRHLRSALYQSLECFADHNIHSLNLQLPGKSAEKIERFRFAINVLPRFHKAATEGTSISFRYYGRTLTIPLINDGTSNKPDPNLTLMAAINGLSALNTRELIRQARAYLKIDLADGKNIDNILPHISAYDQIFKVRSLKSQIIKPPVEVNKILCPYNDCKANTLTKSPSKKKKIPGNDAKIQVAESKAAPEKIELEFKGEQGINRNFLNEPLSVRRQQLKDYVDTADPFITAALDALFSNDYIKMDAMALGRRFVSLTRLLYAVEKRCPNPKLIERILELLQSRFKKVSDKVLVNIITQRQGVKIISEGRALLVGLVHPRLYDLITLVKEHVVAHQRRDLIKDIAFHVDPCHINSLADGFGISSTDANQIIGLLNLCFTANGRFVRPNFEANLDAMTRHENVIFEIFWCLLKQTPERKDRLDFLNAIQLLMDRLNDPKRALQFLLADICYDTTKVEYTDRNAFALANVLFHKENKELYIDVNRTPEAVLQVQRPLNQEVCSYASWRLEVDATRFLEKSQAISNWVFKVLNAPMGKASGPFELHFLLALQRELLIFCSLVTGHTARTVLREAMDKYSNPENQIYHQQLTRQHLTLLIPHLQVLVRAFGRVGNQHDIRVLQQFEQNTGRFSELVPHPAHTLRVRQMMKWVPEAVKMIDAQSDQL